MSLRLIDQAIRPHQLTELLGRDAQTTHGEKALIDAILTITSVLVD